MTTPRHDPIPPTWRVVVTLCLLALGCAGVLTLGSWIQSAPPASALSCGTALWCSGAGNTGDGVDLWRGITRPGNGGGPVDQDHGGGTSESPDESPCVRPATSPGSCGRDPVFAVPGPENPRRPNLSLYDLRHVVPQSPGLTTEPAGWSIVNLPTNLIGFASPHLRRATVLGYAVEVEFIPRSYSWTYGDGGTAVGGTPGETWAHLGVGEFGVTPTAHVYRSAGQFSLSLAVGYAARYRYTDEGWRWVQGLVTARSAPVSLLLGSFDRALVSLR